MAGTLTMSHPFFDASTFPWHHPDAVPARQALLAAYPQFDSIDTLYRRCAPVLRPLSMSDRPDKLWKDVLETLTAARALRRLCELVLEDPAAAAAHGAIQRLVGATGSGPPERNFHIINHQPITQAETEWGARNHLVPGAVVHARATGTAYRSAVDVLERLQLSVARITGLEGQIGTAFVFSRTLAITCAHCIASTGDPRGKRVSLNFTEWLPPAGVHRTGTVLAAHGDVDVAILELDRPLPVDALPLIATAAAGAEWMSFGHPLSAERDGMVLRGRTVADPRAGAWQRRMIQLHFPDAEFKLEGASGAPIVVDGGIVGVLSLQPNERQTLCAVAFETIAQLDGFRRHVRARQPQVTALGPWRKPVQRVPGRAIARTWGWLAHRFERTRLAKSVAVEQTSEPSPLRTLLYQESFRFGMFERTLAVPTKPAVVVLQEGLAGSGKTTTIQQQLASRECDLVLRIAPHDLAAFVGTPDGADEKLWQCLVDYVDGAASPTGLAYCLLARRCVVVLDDLHLVGRPCADVLERLRDYFTRHHRWAANLTVLAATRGSPTVPLYVARVVVPPFSRDEARRFFLQICHDNDFPHARVAAIGVALAAAFQHELARTPLLVVLSAFAAYARRFDTDSMNKILGDGSHVILGQFVSELLARARDLIPEENCAVVERCYRGLALAIWPRWTGLADDDVQNALAVDGSITTSTLVGAGLLVRLPDSPGLAFPHPGLVDYCAIACMLERRDFSRLQTASVAPSELVPMILASMPEMEHTIVELAHDAPRVFLDVIRAHGALLPVAKPDWMEKIADHLAHCAGTRRLAAAGWERVRIDIADRYRRFRDDLCAHLERTPATSAAIEALLVLSGERCLQLVDRWIRTAAGNVFTSELQSPVVRAYLIRRLSHRELGPQVLVACWDRGSSEFDDAAAALLRKDQALLTRALAPAWLRAERDLVSLERLLYELRGVDLAPRADVSRGVVEVAGRLLVPRGTYRFTHEKKQVTREITRGFLLPVASREILTVSPNIDRRALLPYEDAQVAHYCFKINDRGDSVYHANGRLGEMLRESWAAFTDVPYAGDPKPVVMKYRIPEYL